MQRLFSDHYLQALTPDERALMAKVRDLCRERIGPAAADVARSDTFCWDTFRLLCESGIVATAFPKEYGGSDARQLVRIRIVEELGRVCSAAASLITGTDLSARALVAGGSVALKQELLPALAAGSIQSAFALTEPAAGSDVRGLTTRVRRTDGGYLINGRKKFITRAGVADWFVVIGRLEDESGQFVALLTASGANGVTVGCEDGKLGWYGVPIAGIAFDEVFVPDSHRLGNEGEGFALAQDALLRARIGHASMAIGRAIGAAEICALYTADRSVAGKALGQNQGVQWMLAEMTTSIEAARALVALAAEKYDRGDADAAIFASMAKLHATDLGMRVVTDALQLTGGRGYLRDFPLERFFRDAKLNQIGEGASEVHKTVIGRDVVRRVRDSERNPCLRNGPLTDY